MAAQANGALTDGGRHFKCVVVGDSDVGKTCLMHSFTTNRFDGSYNPTLFNNYATSFEFEKNLVNAVLWDTSGVEQFDRLRQLAYPNTDIFIICYSIDNPASYENVTKTWLPEIKHHQPTTPYMLVATKADLRNSESADGAKLISTSQGLKLQKEIGAEKYMECSAKTQNNVKQVFEAAARVAMRPVIPLKPKKRCVIM